MDNSTDARLTYLRTFRGIATQLASVTMIAEWYRAGIPAENAAAWANQGYTPGEGIPLARAALSR